MKEKGAVYDKVIHESCGDQNDLLKAVSYF